jgi:hypothetical protein
MFSWVIVQSKTLLTNKKVLIEYKINRKLKIYSGKFIFFFVKYHNLMKFTTLRKKNFFMSDSLFSQ